MRSIIRATVLATVSVLALGGAVEAKTLVYCSEGSPEGFSPMLFTAGTTFDASSKPIYNRLIEFEHGDTKTIPGLAESFTVSDDGLVYTFKLRQGVKWHSTAGLHAHPRLQRRRRRVHVHAAARSEPSLQQGLGRHLRVLRQHGHGQPAEVRRESRRPHGQVHPERATGAVHRQSRHGLRLDHVGGVCRADDAGGHAREARSGAGRHRAVPAGRLPEGRGDPLQGQRRLLGAASRRSTISCSRSRRTPRSAIRSSRPASAR